MKRIIAIIAVIFFAFSGCEEKVVYQDDPRLYNDAFHGNIVGKILQQGIDALVIVNQEVPVDSTYIDMTNGTFRIEDLPVGNYDLTIRAENYRTFTLSNIMVNGAGTTYIGEIDLLQVPDLVSYHYPADLDEIVVNKNSRLSISMAFTRPMNRESVEIAFSTDPPSEGIFNWGSYIYTRQDDYYRADNASGSGAIITTYSKITSFTYVLAQKDTHVDTTYRVSLSTAAQDTAGNHLSFPLNFSFSTIQSSTTIQGIQTYPSHGDIDVGLISNSGIQITFPRNMNQTSTENAITMIPGVDVIFIWPQKNVLTIYTGGPYIAETTYQITINDSAKDLDGVPLDETFSFSFTTDVVKVENTWPRNGELFVDYQDPYVTLWFNTYIVKSTVEKAFTISPQISGSFKWGTNSSDNKSGTTLTFYPSEALKPNTKYTVTIDDSVSDLYGINLNEPYSFSFVTRPE
ncbi:MAG: Ig-like domain-containing protein [Candidatus Latescibacteria bacterium]|nr:Ig-like domain-containing protein [Candidatus Latescibacterota bacterium]